MNDVVCVRDEHVIVEIFIHCKKSLIIGGGVKINCILVFCEGLIAIHNHRLFQFCIFLALCPKMNPGHILYMMNTCRQSGMK